MRVAHIRDHVPEAGMDEELFVVTETMKKIEDGKVRGFVCAEGGWKNDAVGYGPREDFAGEGIAFDAARSSMQGKDEEKEKKGSGKYAARS
jgi:hypothetical protein